VLICQFGRFLLVGLSNTAISLAAYAVLVGVGLHYLPAGGVAFALGAVNGYFLNRHWTFGRPRASSAPLKYLVVQLGGLGLTEILLWLFASAAGAGRFVAFFATLPIVTVVTFAANRTWTFEQPLRTSN
jgi:putative flippase GtrA